MFLGWPCLRCYELSSRGRGDTEGMTQKASPSVWQGTQWKYVTKRDGRFRVVQPGKRCFGLFSDSKSALDCIVEEGEEVIETKANRFPQRTFL